MSNTRQTQLQLTSKHGSFELVPDQAIPKPGPGYVLVKVDAAALSIGRFKHSDFMKTTLRPWVQILLEKSLSWEKVSITGRFFQGTWSKENSCTGYCQYALAEAEYAGRIPSNISSEQASTIPVALATAVVALYGPKPLGVELTSPFVEGGRDEYKDQPLVVLGGATSVGQIVLQLAKLSGFSPVITTTSLKHESLLRSLGATHVLDRHLPDSELAAQVGSITSEPITLVYESAGIPPAQATGYSLLSSTEPAQLITVMPSAYIQDEDKVPNKEIISTFGAFTVPITRELGKQLYKELEGLVERGEVRPNRVEVLAGGLAGGLAGVVGGLERLKNGEVSAGKLVIRPQETV